MLFPRLKSQGGKVIWDTVLQALLNIGLDESFLGEDQGENSHSASR